MSPWEGTDAKPVSKLAVKDIIDHPVWKYSANDSDPKDPLVRPVSRLPVTTLASKVVGAQLRLANGTRVWALIGNVDLHRARLNQHFLTISVERNGRWFHLARYHDHDYDSRGPEALAGFLGFEVDEVFPIAFDLRHVATGSPDVLTGVVSKEPSERLSRAQIIALAVS